MAALLGLLAVFCVGQDPVPPQNRASAESGSARIRLRRSRLRRISPSQNQFVFKAPASPLSEGRSAEPRLRRSQAPQNQAPQNQSQITLDSSETIFSVLTALNACGYDQDLTISDATRSNVRAEVQRNLRDSEEAEAARTALCEFYQDHVASKDANRNLSQYISLALYMDGPAAFCAAGERGRSASGCGGDYGFRNAAGTLLRESEVALDLGAAPQRLRGGDEAVSRTAGQDGVRHARST